MPHRWALAALLFASTTINYIDRQTLSVLAPLLQEEYRWSNSQFALIVVAFRVAYTIGQTGSGRMLDRLGTRTGLMVGVAFYSAAAMATSLARGLSGFAFFRFLLGLGESANWPGAAKAVSEWFPARERALAVALYDSGSAIGGAVAPVLVLGLLSWFGSWRPAFAVTGTLGLLWLAAWWRFAPRPAARDASAPAPEPPPPMASLLAQRKTWGLILGRTLTDPVWFFVSDWFAIYLVSKGFRLEETAAGFWVPFLAADLGNFAGGGLSSWLIHRGWNTLRARQFVVVAGGLGMTLLIPTLWSSSFFVIVGFFAIATFAYAAFSTMMLALPADLYPSRAVASVSGMTGTGAGLGTIVSTLLIGWVSDHYSFGPVLAVASLIPLAAVAATLWLVREQPDPLATPVPGAYSGL